jgi:undecaprenyl-diphosphatase
MNAFDVDIVLFLNRFAHRSWVFDNFISQVLQNDILKSGVITALLWWAWFRTPEQEDQRREIIISGLFAAFVAIVSARILALSLPFRVRPLHEPSVHFVLPYGIDQDTLIHWSSFPSDHAALFFALATTLFFVSHRLGIFAYVYVLFVICFTRLYLGYHYPSDILAGALLGIIAAFLCKIPAIRKTVAQPPIRWLHRDPASFYTSFFLVTFLIATIFDPIRHLARFVVSATKAALKL